MSEGEIKVVHASIEQAAAEIAALQEMALALVPVEKTARFSPFCIL